MRVKAWHVRRHLTPGFATLGVERQVVGGGGAPLLRGQTAAAYSVRQRRENWARGRI